MYPGARAPRLGVAPNAYSCLSRYCLNYRYYRNYLYDASEGTHVPDMQGSDSLRSVEEVHIAPLGYEYDRIGDPVVEYGVDTLHLLTDSELETTAYHERLEQELTDHGVVLEYHETDLDDVYDVLGRITTLIDGHQGDIVRVNVSSGPKLATVGAALACMATDASGYHVRTAEHLHPVAETPQTGETIMAEQLPSYPLETPTTDQVRILNYVDEHDTAAHTPNKSELIDFAEREGLAFISDSNPANDKAKFALLNNRIVEPLLEDGYVSVESVGRTKRISLTETGGNALRAFRHKLPAESDGG